MSRVFISILLASLLFTTMTIGGMTLLVMDHGMSATDTMICIDHCLQVFSVDSIVPTLLPGLLIVALFFLSATRDTKSTPFLAHPFQRWRNALGIFLRHQQLSTIVLLD